MDVHERIRGLMEERGWSEYRLAQKAGLSQSAISNLFRRHTLPSIPTLEAICNGFGLTLSQFFAQGGEMEVTAQQKELLERFAALSEVQKAVLLELLSTMNLPA